MEYMNLYEHVHASFPVPDPETPGNPMKMMNVDVKVMLNSKTKQAAYAMTGLLPGLPEDLGNCSFIKVPWLKDPEDLAKCVKEGFEKEGLSPPKVPGMDIKGPTCKRDGEFDRWELSFKNESEIGNVEVTEAWKMDDDFVMREIALDVKAGKMATVAGKLETKGTPTQVGPSDADLDFKQWGYKECKEMPMGPGGPPEQAMEYHVMRKVNEMLLLQSRPAAMSLIPRLMMARGRRLQGGMPPGGLPPGMPDIPAWGACFMPSMPPGVVTV